MGFFNFLGSFARRRHRLNCMHCRRPASSANVDRYVQDGRDTWLTCELPDGCGHRHQGFNWQAWGERMTLEEEATKRRR
jgi:hypothetical protein